MDGLSLTGFQGIAVEPLARRLGVSKGSFYWHFSALLDLVDAVLSAWKSRGFAELARIADPKERLIAMIQTAWRDPGSFRAEAALSAAALAGHPQVAPVVEEVMFGRLEYDPTTVVSTGDSKYGRGVPGDCGAFGADDCPGGCWTIGLFGIGYRPLKRSDPFAEDVEDKIVIKDSGPDDLIFNLDQKL